MRLESARRAAIGLAWLVLAGAASAPRAAHSACELKRIAELPIVMRGLRPMITVRFNGKDADLMLDSGAFYSTISSATAGQYGLKLYAAPWGLRVKGIGGYADVSAAMVKDFGLLGVTIHNVEFLVGGSEVGSGGVLGQNFLETFDVEYDLEHGAVRLFKSHGCAKTLLAYWSTPDKPYSTMGIFRIDERNPHTLGTAYVNGKQIRVLFDTGANTSVLSLKAAERAGVKIDSPGVVEAGFSSGIGRGSIKSYLARFDSFKIGDTEEIKNARLRLGDIDLGDADMLLGADFFVSHRLFVSNQEHKVFITYNGGPVFNLASNAMPAAPLSSGDEPKDADGYARRGAGHEARRDFDAALADLSKACELSPGDPEYFFRRALIYLETDADALALADLDHALTLKADFLPAYLPRAQIHLRQKNEAAARADLDSVDRLAPKQADLRLQLAAIEERLENYPASIAQYDLWIDSHAEDSRLVAALDGRCLSSALGNQDLPRALSDCNKALQRADRTMPAFGLLYADRGLVYLRQGNADKAIADFNDALKAMPQAARALYGRAVAESRKNMIKESAADLAAARAIAPRLPDRYRLDGLAP